MDFDYRTIQRHVIHFQLYQLVLLECEENPIQDAILGPTVGARVNAVPIAEFHRQTTPLTAVLCNLQNRVEHFQIRECDVTPLYRQ